MCQNWNTRFADFSQALKYGFSYTGAFLEGGNAYKSKPGSHDDGPSHGPFLGALGGPNYSRDLTGGFSRWHLQPGVHLLEHVPQAAFLLHLKSEASSVCRFIGTKEPPSWDNYLPSFSAFPEETRTGAVLFPASHEYYLDQSLPLELLLTCWSPLIYGSEDSALPVLFFSFAIKNSSARSLTASIAHFWPNLLGWRQGAVTTDHRGGRAWPGQSHSGNINVEDAASSTGVLQQRYPDSPLAGDLEGEIFLDAWARGVEEAAVFFSREACFKADQNALREAPSLQKHTQGWVQEYFAATGLLPDSGKSWQAHWHEPLSSALSCKVTLEPGQCCEITFLHVWDTPMVKFGSRRAWKRKYVSRIDDPGRSSRSIGQLAREQEEQWWSSIRRQTTSSVFLPGWEASITGAVLNERFFLTGGGTVWIDGEANPGELPAPVLGGGEHFGLLEGFDTGYFYYNTFDLWAYAFPSLMQSWPSLASLVFDEYLRSIPLVDKRERIVYRVMEERSMLIDGKIPHDVGNPMEDPWHELNGYTMRDDPNTWRDHNPAFLISYYLFHHKNGSLPATDQWELVKKAFTFLLSHDEDGDGLPEHKEFGDSTWDALSMKGVSSFSGGLSLAACAAIVSWADHYADMETGKTAATVLARGASSFEEKLWNGSFYRTDSQGVYSDSVMIDALIGPFYAGLSGLGSLLPEKHICSHLKCAYEYNLLRYNEGKSGPLLVSDGTGRRFSPDGGEELQINEVLVGSSWLFCAMLRFYGLEKEAAKVAAVLSGIVYRESGLQFRTPAAWDSEGFFRAPLNMRPLAAGLLAWV
jgi:non-lysosomal glucosylceramidase